MAAHEAGPGRDCQGGALRTIYGPTAPMIMKDVGRVSPTATPIVPRMPTP
jgi:hypothetical protein